MPKQIPSDLIALQMSGDLAGVTYVQRGGSRRTSYAKTYPRREPSGTQMIFRERFKVAVRAWQALPAAKKATLETITFEYSMIMSGFNLFISCHLNNRMEWIDEWAQALALPW
jgi:hypothetical protein